MTRVSALALCWILGCGGRVPRGATPATSTPHCFSFAYRADGNDRHGILDGRGITIAPAPKRKTAAQFRAEGKTRCRFEVTVASGQTALHSGRPLYCVTCTVHGLVHPSTTSASHWLNAHLDDETTVWL